MPPDALLRVANHFQCDEFLAATLNTPELMGGGKGVLGIAFAAINKSKSGKIGKEEIEVCVQACLDHDSNVAVSHNTAGMVCQQHCFDCQC